MKDQYTHLMTQLRPSTLAGLAADVRDAIADGTLSPSMWAWMAVLAESALAENVGPERARELIEAERDTLRPEATS